ncbi:hypothetical protein HZC33_01720 [Candidatus Wolfebacteria bacterium]|nr:hypothetical protein [Candidatus Wolfebacteria bacterium]
MTTITIPIKIEKELKLASQNLGFSKEELLTNAILYYLQILEKKIELKNELNQWEKISNIDLIKFEQEI